MMLTQAPPFTWNKMEIFGLYSVIPFSVVEIPFHVVFFYMPFPLVRQSFIIHFALAFALNANRTGSFYDWYWGIVHNIVSISLTLFLASLNHWLWLKVSRYNYHRPTFDTAGVRTMRFRKWCWLLMVQGLSFDQSKSMWGYITRW